MSEALDREERMKKRAWVTTLRAILALLVFSGIATGCNRSSSEVWEDTKTGGNYFGRGLKSVAGKHGDSRQVGSRDEFLGSAQDDYVPLDNSDLYEKLVAGDQEALDQINAYSQIPVSRENPGEAGSTLPDIEHFADPQALHVEEIFRNIPFNYNDYVVQSEEARIAIKKIAAYMKEHPELYLVVEGHCDERGSAAYNLALGSRRSNSVRALLVKERINPDRVFTITYGKERPIVAAHTPEGWAANRRAQFKVYEK